MGSTAEQQCVLNQFAPTDSLPQAACERPEPQSTAQSAVSCHAVFFWKAVGGSFSAGATSYSLYCPRGLYMTGLNITTKKAILDDAREPQALQAADRSGDIIESLGPIYCSDATDPMDRTVPNLLPDYVNLTVAGRKTFSLQNPAGYAGIDVRGRRVSQRHTDGQVWWRFRRAAIHF